MINFPDQPMVLDDSGVPRFQANKIVSYLLEMGGLDMNHLVKLHHFSDGKVFDQRDWDQFYQLIGYSLAGYGELNLVSAAAYGRAEKAATPKGVQK